MYRKSEDERLKGILISLLDQGDLFHSHYV